ncbi:MAG: hypothetical protein ACRDTR_06190, partial [Rubrobacter sp.]
LISSRQPRNPVGWFVLGHAFCFTLGEFTRQYAIYGAQTDPGSLPFARAVIWPTYWVWYPGLVLLISLLPLYFPNGRLLSGRWRWVVRFTVLIAAFATARAMFSPSDIEAPGIPNPLGIQDSSGELGFLLTSSDALLRFGWLGLGIVSAASLVLRFRRSLGVERQQIKWVAYAVVFMVSYFILGQIVFDILLPARFPQLVDQILFLVALQSLWIAIAVAILRYRLYDIDVIINRTLVYGALTISLGLVYVGAVVGLQYVFRALTGGGSSLAVVASTLLIAALFSPLRHRIQGFIDRSFYRRKYDAAKTLESFGSRLKNEVEPDALNEELLRVVNQTMQPSHVSVWLREPNREARR